MLRYVSPVFIALATLAQAQQPESPAPTFTRPVLKALPLGGDDDINSKPLPDAAAEPSEDVGGEAVVPAQPAAPVAPALPPIEPAKPIETVSTPSPLDMKPVGDDAVRLQIFLDESKFGPGVIDGKPGRFTELAVMSWNEVHGHPSTDWVAVNTAARQAVKNPLAIAVVPDISTKWVDATLPTKRSLQAKRKRMAYRSYVEFMAERYHCDVPFLVTLNGNSKVNNLKPHDTLIVPNVQPFTIERLTGAGFKADEAMSQRHAVVDTKINQVRIFEAAPAALVVAEPGTSTISTVTRANRGLIASFPITPGKPQFIKFGTWQVRNSVELPHWRYDQKLLDTGKRSSDSEALNIPPGPNSPVGVFWCGLSKPGIGLHGTSDPETIGRARSAGCIRLANWDAVRLSTLIRPGTTVEIR
jgi:lipoprotein-anchoring transpeptidase ErfK/SrfK